MRRSGSCICGRVRDSATSSGCSRGLESLSRGTPSVPGGPVDALGHPPGWGTLYIMQHQAKQGSNKGRVAGHKQGEKTGAEHGNPSRGEGWGGPGRRLVNTRNRSGRAGQVYVQSRPQGERHGFNEHWWQAPLGRKEGGFRQAYFRLGFFHVYITTPHGRRVTWMGVSRGDSLARLGDWRPEQGQGTKPREHVSSTPTVAMSPLQCPEPA